MKRLATLLAMSLSIGCATDPHAGDSPGGGDGKADDTCESAAYRTWLTDEYLPGLGQIGLPLTEEGLAAALASAETKPCTTGSDDDYALWFQQFNLQAMPVITRHQAANDSSVTTQQKYDQAMASAMPSDAEVRLLSAFLAVAPERSGARGYAEWVRAYDEVLSLVYSGKGTSTMIFERNAVIAPAEAPLLAAFEDARPETSQEAGYAAWFEMFRPWNQKAFLPGADESVQTFVARLLDLRPASRADTDYLTWFQAFYEQERAAYQTATSSTTQALAALDTLVVALPLATGGGLRSYKPWFGAFGEAFGAALGQDAVLTEGEKARLERFVTTVPCSDNPADTALFDNLNARRARFGEAAAYLDRVAPASCTP